MTEYRQDDRTDTGYCPICGERVTTVFVDGAGWCPDHGRVWCDWTPRVPPAVSDDDALLAELISPLHRDDEGSDAA